MKKHFTLFLLLFSVSLFAQVTTPTVETTYLPVKGTSVKQIWETAYNQLAIPSVGANQVWDYSTKFNVSPDTHVIKTMDPSLTPYGQYFQNATHASFLTTPFNDVSDSLYSYFIIDSTGLYNIGGFSEKYDSLYKSNPIEMYVPTSVTFGDNDKDTSRFIGFVNHYPVGPFLVNAKIREFKAKDVTVVGYGTLKLPGANYNNVLLAKEITTRIDSFFIETSPGIYATTPTTVQTSNYIVYYFIRNNTFGTSYLMQMTVNAADNIASFGYYNLPVDIGSISGTVYTDLTETTTVTNGEAYLYRENSNFAKNDILAIAPLDAGGNYKFDSIPYGIYRVAIRPNITNYPNAFITYYGDTTDWLVATPITTFSVPASVNNNIHLQYQQAAGNGHIVGRIGLNSSIMRTMQAPPVPGIGIVIKKNPGGGASRGVLTDLTGGFDLGDLADGNYELFVDIPGLYMAGTYSVTIAGGTAVNGLDFTVGTHSIHPNAILTNINEVKTEDNTSLRAYPNPYQLSSNIQVQIQEAAEVNLEVYNLLGEKVQVLDKGVKAKGIYNYAFSAKKLNYSVGIYLLRLTVNGKISTLKLVEQ